MKYHKLDNRKLLLNFERPFTKGLYNNNNQNKLKYNLHMNHLNTKNYQNKIKNNYTPIKTFNFLKDKKNNEILKTSPIKYQYRKIPLQKVKGFKFKLPNNNNLNIKHQKNKTNVNYPIICDHNNSTIQSNFNYNYNYNNTIKDTLNARMETINHQEDIYLNLKNINNKDNNMNKDIIVFNKIKKPIYHQIIETKSSSLGSKYETREESAHFLKSKSSLNNIRLIKKEKEKEKQRNMIKNFSFLKFERKQDKINISPNKKLLKYINKAIKQLNKIKILITEKTIKKENFTEINSKENFNNNNIRIDLSKIGNNLKKYKNIIDIDNNRINLSFERNDKIIGINNNINYLMDKKRNKYTFKKLNRTITYDDLKSNYKKGNKAFNINKRNKMEFFNKNKYNTINNEDKYKIKNFDTEIKIPKIDINYIKRMKNNTELNLINEEDKYINNNNRLKDRYKNENDEESNYNNNTDIANFEFSD